VNFSEVYGEAPSFLKKEFNLDDAEPLNFVATGVSLVIHPRSPMVPIIHMNVRYLELTSNSKPQASSRQWFGGGIDLTPIYINEHDAKFFHQQLKSSCDKFDPSNYPDFKKSADDYFFIPHRKETRGIGGIFFDRLIANEYHSIEDRFEFVKAIGETFLPVYSEIVRLNAPKAFTEKQKQWQLMRRGRYAEFNLVYDRGTKFGLLTDGRTESILMSLPPMASWLYNFIPEKGSEEETTLAMLRKGIEWA
jgi:coproporphyrinogen III oxidase